jgi:hypothetical protein
MRRPADVVKPKTIPVLDHRVSEGESRSIKNHALQRAGRGRADSFGN